MRGFLALVLGACLTGALAAQQPQAPTTGGTLWISAGVNLGESARLIVNGETVGLVDRLRVVAVPFGSHVVRVESLRTRSSMGRAR